MQSKDKEPTATAEDMAAVQKQLSETLNDPNLVITCWSHTFCTLCNKFAGECQCQCQPWNWSLQEQTVWYHSGQPRHSHIPLLPF